MAQQFPFDATSLYDVSLSSHSIVLNPSNAVEVPLDESTVREYGNKTPMTRSVVSYQQETLNENFEVPNELESTATNLFGQRTLSTSIATMSVSEITNPEFVRPIKKTLRWDDVLRQANDIHLNKTNRVCDSIFEILITYIFQQDLVETEAERSYNTFCSELHGVKNPMKFKEVWKRAVGKHDSWIKLPETSASIQTSKYKAVYAAECLDLSQIGVKVRVKKGERKNINQRKQGSHNYIHGNATVFSSLDEE